jgi:hypothetical protein
MLSALPNIAMMRSLEPFPKVFRCNIRYSRSGVDIPA